jgi:hypothetical protein
MGVGVGEGMHQQRVQAPIRACAYSTSSLTAAPGIDAPASSTTPPDSA